MALEERYTYTVHPRRPIRNIIQGTAILRPMTLSLTKEEVLKCIKYGAVYRKFYMDSNLEKVTPSNLDRLHRQKHITEAEYKAMFVEKWKSHKDIVEILKDELKSEEGQVEDATPILDDQKEESADTTEEKKVEEEQLSTDNNAPADSVENDETEGVEDEESKNAEIESTEKDSIDEKEADSNVSTDISADSLDESKPKPSGNPASKSGKKKNRKKNSGNSNHSVTSSVPETAPED